MGLVQFKEELRECEVIDFIPKKDVKLKKDGTPKLTPCNSIKGKAKEVYPLKSKDDIQAIKTYFIDKINSATNIEDKKISGRNLMMFTISINIGLRFSDVVTLKWGDVLDKDNSFKEGIRRSEKKTGKFKTFFLNQSCKDAISEYINMFNVKTKQDRYIFESREGNNTPIKVQTSYKALKKAAMDIGFKKNFGTHSARKTFGYWFYTTHNEDIKALTYLQRMFSHSSSSVTLKYIGIEDEETKQFYDDLNL